MRHSPLIRMQRVISTTARLCMAWRACCIVGVCLPTTAQAVIANSKELLEMKPLVNYCRWQGATLRLRGRDESAVWGQLVFLSENGEEAPQNFRFNLRTSQLSLSQKEGESLISLDEMGVPLERS